MSLLENEKNICAVLKSKGDLQLVSQNTKCMN